MRTLVVGAGVGGLSAALRLARLGRGVTVFEARPRAGGLASPVEADGVRFDGGPYILLDRPGLEWAFSVHGLDIAALRLVRLEEPYVAEVDGQRVEFHADLARTVAGFDRAWPGSGARYAAFVDRAGRAYDRLAPALRKSRPGPIDLLRAGPRAAAFVFRTLGGVLAGAGLPAPVAEALAVWTRVAGHDPLQAPGFMAFVPALVHRVGCYACPDGLDAIVEALRAAAQDAGVVIRTDTRVEAIEQEGGRVRALALASGERLPADAVVSDVGLATYLSLVRPVVRAAAERLAALPLQSPGGCAYVLARGTAPRPYLRFRIDRRGTRLLVSPAAVTDAREPFPLRLIAPIAHAEAEAMDESAQSRWLDALVDEPWWRDGLTDVRVVARRRPADWGREFALFRNAMNPVMTPRLARAGRLAHRSPWVRGLYLVGSATHPGQWVSFCTISGILGADALHEDAAGS